MSKWVNNLRIDDFSALTTNAINAFNQTFDLLNKSNNGYCKTSILLLTDGYLDDPSAIIKERNTEDINAVIFSYTFGDNANGTIPEKIADITNGIYAHIGDNDDSLITKFASFSLYYAYGNTEGKLIVTSI